MAVWECTVEGCDFTSPQPDCAKAVKHMARNLNRAPHPMRRRLSGPHHEGPERTTVCPTPDESGREGLYP